MKLATASLNLFSGSGLVDQAIPYRLKGEL